MIHFKFQIPNSNSNLQDSKKISPPLGFESQRLAGGNGGEGEEPTITLTPPLSRQGRGKKEVNPLVCG